MTKLQAINEMLEALGAPPVLSLDTGGNSLEAEAESILDRETRRILSSGWHGNTYEEKTYTPDDSGHIDISNVLNFRGDGKYTRRGNLLYDLDADTDVHLTSAALTRVVVTLQLEDLIDSLQNYIIKASAAVLVKYKKQDSVEDRRANEASILARREAVKENGRLKAVNLLDGDQFTKIKGEPRG